MQMDVMDIYTTLLKFVASIHKIDEAAQKQNLPLKIEVSHFVDGLEPGERIMQGYLVSVTFKIKKINEGAELPRNRHYWVIMQEQAQKQVEKMIQVNLVDTDE